MLSFGRLNCALLIVGSAIALTGCDRAISRPGVRPQPDAAPFNDAGEFFCATLMSRACVQNKYYSCVPDGEFLAARVDDCTARNEVCLADRGCASCRPNERSCRGNDVVMCNGEGSSASVIETCDRANGFACVEGFCKSLCEEAVRARSYQGCEFFAADLDNAAISLGRDATMQQYAVVVSNPNNIPTDVVVERNDALVGQPPVITEVMRTIVPPGDLEILRLPRREVDGASSNQVCGTMRACPADELCVTTIGDQGRCRRTMTSTGLNDGTHTALTSRAYRIRSLHPVVAYQFNPLDNVDVFSNDASLLIPTSSIGTGPVRYSIVGWPQTIADSTNPAWDFDSTTRDEDLRAFLTIIGTQPNTEVSVRLGPQAYRVVGGGPVPEMTENMSYTTTLGAFDVLNLETQRFLADFTGSVVQANKPVVVFVGSEASDAPRFENLETRQCCADHLEEQAFPDAILGRQFVIARTPRRSRLLNAAFEDPVRDRVADVNEPEWVRILAVDEGATTISTTLPRPNNRIVLDQGRDTILRADQDFEIESDKRVVVLQVQASQQAVGIPNEYPGGDPDIVYVPPVEQWRRDYTLLTPLYYGFDAIIISAPFEASVRLDGEPVEGRCERSPGDGIVRGAGDPDPDRVIWRCQLGFPEVTHIGERIVVNDGEQNDGVHTVAATQPVSVLVWGFDSFVSFAYAGGLNFEPLQ